MHCIEPVTGIRTRRLGVKVQGDHVLTAIENLRGQGDPLADAALSDYQDARPEVRALLEEGMRLGSANVGGLPDRFKALLRDCEAVATILSDTDFELAMQPYSWIGPTWISIALGPGSLAHTYSDPAIAAVLMRTGNLASQTVSRRLLETQLWKVSVIKPRGMAIGGSGYVHTIQVRLLHARVRATLLQRGWTSPDGRVAMPIDQWQMLRTWLDFTVVPFEAFKRIGFDLSDDQIKRLYQAWRVVGHLLGVDPAILSKVTDHTVALELLDVIDRQLQVPDEHCRLLTQAMLDAIGQRLAPVLGLPADVSVMLMGSMCRLFHGDDLAEKLGVQSNWTASLLSMVSDANRFRFARMRTEPDDRQRMQRQSLDAFNAIEAGLTDTTVYQAMSQSLATPDLPSLLMK